MATSGSADLRLPHLFHGMPFIGTDQACMQIVHSSYAMLVMTWLFIVTHLAVVAGHLGRPVDGSDMLVMTF